MLQSKHITFLWSRDGVSSKWSLRTRYPTGSPVSQVIVNSLPQKTEAVHHVPHHRNGHAEQRSVNSQLRGEI